MTRIVCTRAKDGTIASLRAKGHAGYDVEGYDIVCAAISALMQTAALALEEECGIPPAIVEEDVHITLTAPMAAEPERILQDAQIILRTAWRGLQAIAQEYPKHLTTQEV